MRLLQLPNAIGVPEWQRLLPGQPAELCRPASVRSLSVSAADSTGEADPFQPAATALKFSRVGEVLPLKVVRGASGTAGSRSGLRPCPHPA